MPEATEEVMGIVTLTDPSADHHEPSANGKRKRKMGALFWAATGWIVLVVFCAIFAPFLPLQSTTKSDPCSTLASSMGNYGIDGNAAKLLDLAQADPPAEAQQMSDRGVQAQLPPGDDCPHPSLDSKVRATAEQPALARHR